MGGQEDSYELKVWLAECGGVVYARGLILVISTHEAIDSEFVCLSKVCAENYSVICCF